MDVDDYSDMLGYAAQRSTRKRARDDEDYDVQQPRAQSRRTPRNQQPRTRPLTAYQEFVSEASRSGRFAHLPAKERMGAIASEWRLSGRAATPRPRKRATTNYNEYQKQYGRAYPGAYENSAMYQPPRRRPAGGGERAESAWNVFVREHMPEVMHLPPRSRLGALSQMRMSGGSIRRRR